MTREQKLTRWAERELRRNINHLILDGPDGAILAFGVYSITPQTDGVHVSNGFDIDEWFQDRRTALSWCVARRLNLPGLAEHIRTLSQNRMNIAQDIRNARQRASRCQSAEYQDLVLTKLQSKIFTLRTIDSELEKCVYRAKYLQLRGINDETARARFS